MASPSEEILVAEVREKLGLDLGNLSGAEAHKEFSERLDDFLEEKGLDESDIISGKSEYAPILSKEAFNGLEFSGMEGTGLTLADVRHIMTDDDHRLEMAEKHLTGNEEARIRGEHTEYEYHETKLDPAAPYDPYDPVSPVGSLVGTLSQEGFEALKQPVKIKEFMHYELRDALNAGEHGLPATLKAFEESEDRDEWREMPEAQAALHQNSGKVDRKFIHDDGRELVFDGDTEKIMTAGILVDEHGVPQVDEHGVPRTNDQFMGTYNYENATIPRDATPDPLESLQNILTNGSRAHKAYDVDPWVEMGNTRADRYANGGEEARAELLKDSAIEAGVKSLGNIGDVQEKVKALSEAKDWVSDKAGQAGEAISDGFEGVARGMTESFEDLTRTPSHRNSIDEADPYSAPPSNGLRNFLGLSPDIGKSFGAGSWQEGALNPGHQAMNGAHIQQASFSETPSETAKSTSSGTVALEDAIGMLAADQKTLNAATTGEAASPVRDALNHPDAGQMFQNLHTHGVKTLTAEITPDMSAEDRVSEILLGGREATHEAGIPMPSEQRALEATRELQATQELYNSYEDDYSLGV